MYPFSILREEKDFYQHTKALVLLCAGAHTAEEGIFTNCMRVSAIVITDYGDRDHALRAS